MLVSLNTVKYISFMSKSEKDKKNEAEKKVVTGGGAVAATASAASKSKAAKSGFNMFNSARTLNNGMQTVTKTAESAGVVVKKTTSLWGKVCENAKWAKNSIIEWGKNLKNAKCLKPLLTSSAFRGFAGLLGYGFGLVTLISGLSDIAHVTADTIEKNI